MRLHQSQLQRGGYRCRNTAFTDDLEEPISPVRLTCVPPRNSRDVPISKRELHRHIFAEQSHRAMLYCIVKDINCACVATFAKISRLTMTSALANFFCRHRRIVAEVETRFSASTKEPFAPHAHLRLHAKLCASVCR